MYSSHLMLLFILFCDMYQTGSNPVVDRGTWLAVTKSFLPVTRYIFGGTDEPYKFFHIDWLSAITDPFFLRWSATFTKTSLFPCKGKICVSRRLLYVFTFICMFYIFYKSHLTRSSFLLLKCSCCRSKVPAERNVRVY